MSVPSGVPDERTPLTRPQRPPLYVYLIVAAAGLNSVNLGYDIGVNSGVAVLVREDLQLSEEQIGVWLGSLHFVSAFGGLMNHMISDHLGRCLTFTVAQVLFVTGIAVIALAQSFAVLMAGRLFLGVGVGVGLAIDPLYIAEVSPASHRGMLVSWAEITTNFGILLGFIANWALVDLPVGVNWRVMIACGSLLPLIILVLSLTVMPESPRWLVGRGRDEEAAAVLFRTHDERADIPTILGDIKKQVEQEESHARLGWEPFFRPDRATRWMIAVGIGIAFAQQINGSESVVLYSPSIFKDAGVAKNESGLFAVTIVVGVFKLVFIFVSAGLLDTLGRRPLLLLSTCAMAAAQLALALGLLLAVPLLSMVAIWLFVAAFSVGIGPMAWLLAAEVFPLHLRAKAMSVAAFVNRMTSGLILLTFNPLSDALTLSGYYFLFAAITALTAAGAYLLVPETRQRSLEQLAADLQGDGPR